MSYGDYYDDAMSEAYSSDWEKYICPIKDLLDKIYAMWIETVKSVLIVKLSLKKKFRKPVRRTYVSSNNVYDYRMGSTTSVVVFHSNNRTCKYLFSCPVTLLDT